MLWLFCCDVFGADVGLTYLGAMGYLVSGCFGVSVCSCVIALSVTYTVLPFQDCFSCGSHGLVWVLFRLFLRLVVLLRFILIDVTRIGY